MYRALIVEDDPAWRQILTELLTDAGLTVDTADSLPAAITLVRAVTHRLAVVDLSLGGSDHRNQDGLAVLGALRQHDPNCVAILLSGYATVEIAVTALKDYGALTCLRKEVFRRAEFRKVMQEALAAAQFSRPHASGQNATPDQIDANKNLATAGQSGGASAQAGSESEAGRVLVVEDDAGWRSILHEVLTDAGFTVVLTSSYAEALGRLRSAYGKPRFVLAVVDLALTPPVAAQRAQRVATVGAPGPAGIGAAGDPDGFRLLVAAQNSRIPALVVSGAASSVDVERAYAEFGVLAFIAKQTFDRKSFLRTVREATATGLPSALDALTPREREVLDLLVKGLTNNQIADHLVLSPNTVKRHLKAIFAKLDVGTRSAAVAKALAAEPAGGGA